MSRLLFILGLLLITTVAVPVEAAIPATYTNDNFFSSEHDAPVDFSQNIDGSFTGITATGKTFWQRPVVSDIHVHLQRFSIDSAFFYISSFGMINAENDTVALSIYLSIAGWEEEKV